MDVLIFVGEGQLSRCDFLFNGREAAYDGFQFMGAEMPHLLKHRGMGNAASDVLSVEGLIKGDGSVKLLHHLVHFFFEAAAP